MNNLFNKSTRVPSIFEIALAYEDGNEGKVKVKQKEKQGYYSKIFPQDNSSKHPHN